MIDVHAPHEPVHGWRDFFLHIATIVIGLLIAIGLEQTVELLHHRHIVREARENIRRELEENQKDSANDERFLQEDADRMQHNATVAHAYLTDPKALDHQSMSFTFTWNGLSGSAWRSARDSGALTYMPMAEVQRYSDIYVQQEIVEAEAVSVFTRQPDIAAGMMFLSDTSSMTPAETQSVLTGSETTYYRLLTLKQLVIELHAMTEKTLKKD